MSFLQEKGWEGERRKEADREGLRMDWRNSAKGRRIALGFSKLDRFYKKL